MLRRLWRAVIIMVLTAVVLSNLSVATYAAEKQRFCIDILPISSKNARYYSNLYNRKRNN
jgi:hypothetical protein